MFTNGDELRQTAKWPGKGHLSRSKLMDALQGNSVILYLQTLFSNCNTSDECITLNCSLVQCQFIQFQLPPFSFGLRFNFQLQPLQSVVISLLPNMAAKIINT